MKILQVISTLDSRAGGPVEGLIQQGVRMHLHGHDVHTLTLDSPGLKLDARLKSSEVYFLGPSWLGYRLNFRITQWLHDHGAKFDVIIVHGMWGFHGFAVAKVARALGLRYVVFLHGMLDPWFKYQYPIKHLKKWLYWPWAEYRTLRDARLVLFTTAEELLLARKSFWLYAAREKLVGYGIERRVSISGDEKITFLNKFPHLAETRNILFLSRIHEKKGCDLLIKAFAKIASQDSRLHLVIAGPDQSGWTVQLKRIALSLGLVDRITYTGMLVGDEKWGAYDAAEVFALPSHQENFGIVIAEALASGLPVLTTDKVNIWREIQNAAAGIIVTDDQNGVDSMLTDWLLMDDFARKAMSKAAFHCFNENFEIGKVTGNLMLALDSVGSDSLLEHTFCWRKEK